MSAGRLVFQPRRKGAAGIRSLVTGCVALGVKKVPRRTVGDVTRQRAWGELSLLDERKTLFSQFPGNNGEW